MHRPQGPEAITSNPWAPLVQARRVGHQLKYWCRSCQERHSEDACIGTEGCSWADGESEKCTCPLGSGDGYRLPTCDNPEWVAGYDLKETRSLDAVYPLGFGAAEIGDTVKVTATGQVGTVEWITRDTVWAHVPNEEQLVPFDPADLRLIHRETA